MSGALGVVMRPEHWKPWTATQHPSLSGVLLIPIHGWVDRRRTVVTHALINTSDLPLIQNCYWHLQDKERNYARGIVNGRCVGMHRAILDVKDANIHVDHINHNKLDNRRENIRVVTAQQNAFNKRGMGPSGFKGVSFCKRTGRWAAKIIFNGRDYFLGRHHDPESAAQAYDVKAKELFGEHAYLNFPGGC